MSVAIVSTALSLSCGKNTDSRKENRASPEHTPPPALQPAQPPDHAGGSIAPTVPSVPPAVQVSPSVPSLDLTVGEISPNGCIDLQIVSEKTAAFLPDYFVREYLQSFEIKSAPPTGAALARFRDMVSEMALANLFFTQESAAAFLNLKSSVTQSKCDQVQFTDRWGNREIFDVVNEGPANGLHLRSRDTQREEIYLLKSPRALEISRIGPHVDRCPGFSKSVIAMVSERTWGSQSDLLSDQPQVARNLLWQISQALSVVPEKFRQIVSESGDGLVGLNPGDFSELKSQGLNPLIMHCPFDSTPPSADESPPPEETPAPTPQPSPPPPPPPTPTPAPTPQASPAPTATPSGWWWW